MKPLWLIALAGAAMFASAAPADTHEGLDEAVDSLTRAIVADDAADIARWLAHDWMIIDGNGGTIDRTRFLDVVQSGALVHDAMDADHTQVRTLGGLVIWIAEARSSGRYRGQAFTFRERSTSLWVRRDGRWICLFTQLTPIREARAQP